MATASDPTYSTEPFAPPEKASELIDLGAILQAFRRRLWLFLIVAIAVALVVMASYFLIPKKYAAVSQVAVDTQQQNVVPTDQQLVTSQPTDTYAVDTEVQVVQSPTVIRRVVEKLRLYADPEFAQDAMDAEADPATRSPNPAAAHQRAVVTAINNLLTNLVVARSGTAFVIDITYSSRSATTASSVANEIARQSIEAQIEAKSGANNTATAFLDSRLTELRGQVLAADAEVQRYSAANGLLNTGSFLGGPNATSETMSQQEIAAVNGQLSTAQADLAQSRARATTARAQLARGSNGEDVGEALDSPVISQLRQQRATVSGQVADMLTRYGPNYPDLKREQGQLHDIDVQINAEIKRIISNLDAQVKISSGRVASLQNSLSSSQGTLVQNSAASVHLAELKRKADAVRTLYEGYLARASSTRTQQGLEHANTRLVTIADVPTTPVSPKLLVFLALAIVSGAGAGAIAVALREMIDRGVHSSDEVRDATGLRKLATIPELRSTLTKPERRANTTLQPGFVVDRPFSAFTESFRMLRAALYDRATGTPYKVVALTSALPAEGKSTSAICLTRVAALGGERAVLVECDTRRKSAAASTTTTEVGLLEVLAGTASLESALQIDEASGAYLLPLSRKHLAPNDVLASSAMDDLLVLLRQRFDLIVLDTAPVLPIAETRLLAAKADAVAYLVRWGKTPGSAAGAGARLLAESGANVVGAVLTQVNLTKQKLWDRSDAAGYYDKLTAYYA